MNTDRRRALVALTIAGLLWGSTVPLSKIALTWLPPGWLTAIRFAVAAAVLLAVTRPRGRAAWSPKVLAWGAAGYGGTVLLQNTGITRTSVSHAALLIGTAPVMVAIIAVMWHRSVVRPAGWAGFAVSLGGVGLIAAGGGGGANLAGDGMVLASVLLSAVLHCRPDPAAARPRPDRRNGGAVPGCGPGHGPVQRADREPAVRARARGQPAGGGRPLIAGGTLVPFTLFAFGQSRLPAEVAGAFLNIEPLVGAVAGVVVFGNPAGPAQLGGGAAILGGIALSSVRRRGRRTASPGITAPAVAEHAVAEHAAIEAAPVPAALAAVGSPAVVRAGSGHRVAGHRVVGHGVAEHVMAEARRPRDPLGRGASRGRASSGRPAPPGPGAPGRAAAPRRPPAAPRAAPAGGPP